MNEYLDFNLIPLGFQENNSIQDALDEFYNFSASDKKFKFLGDVYCIRPHTKLIASCCNKLVDLHNTLTRAILWQYQNYTITKDAVFNLFKNYPHLGCGCDLYNACLLENDVSNFRKYYQVENFKFYENDSEGMPFEYSGLVEYSKDFGDISLLVDDNEVNLFTFKNGKLDGPYIRYMLFYVSDWLDDIWDFLNEKHNLFGEQLDEVRVLLGNLKYGK